MSIKNKVNVSIILCLGTALILGSSAFAQEQPGPKPAPAGTNTGPKTPPDAAAVVNLVPTEPPMPVDPNAPILVKVEPAELDLGEIPTMDTKSGAFRLVNTDTKPRTVKSVRPSCGCTALKFLPDTVIPAGESVEVSVQLSGGATDGPILHKIVTVQVDGQPDVVLPLKAAAVSFVKMNPPVIDPELNKDGKFTLASKDGQPFRIMSMQPPVIEGFPSEAKAEHELTVDWSKFIEMGAMRRITFYLDHPKCQQAIGTANFPQEVINAAMANNAVNPPMVPPPPPTPVDPDTTLQGLIKDGKNSEVLEKIKGGLEVNHRDGSGMSILSMAARAGNVELMSALLASGADKEMPNNAGMTPLMFAGQSKNAAAVRILLDAGASITARGSVGGTALSWASGLGNAQSVQELIDAGSDVEIVDPITGWTPLIWAAGFGDPASIPILVKALANLEAADIIQGATPLINAARTGKVESIKELIKAGAKLENTDRNGKTALLAAAENSGGTADKIQALIAAGADVHAKDNRKLNALQLARKRTDMRAADVLLVLEPMLAAETPPEAPVHAEAPAGPAAAPAPATNGQPGHEGHDHGH